MAIRETTKRQRIISNTFNYEGPDPYGDLENYKIGILPGRPEDAVHDHRHAFFIRADGKGGVYQGTKFEFWCMEVSTNFGASGETASSRQYDAIYHKTFVQAPYSIKGRVPNEAYYDALVEYIRQSHLSMSKGKPRLRLVIPAANIACYGFVNTISAGHEAQGFTLAPEFDIQFTITADKRQFNQGRLSNEILAYFLNPDEKYWKREERIYLGELMGVRDSLASQAQARRRRAEADRIMPIPDDYDINKDRTRWRVS